MYWHLGAQDPQVTRGSSCVSTLHILYNVCIYMYIYIYIIYIRLHKARPCSCMHWERFPEYNYPIWLCKLQMPSMAILRWSDGSTFIEVGEFFESRDLWAWAAHHQRGGGAVHHCSFGGMLNDLWTLAMTWTLFFHFLFGDKFGGTDIFSGPPMRSQACFFEYVSRCLHLDVLLRFQCMLSKVPSWRSWIMMILLKIWH